MDNIELITINQSSHSNLTQFSSGESLKEKKLISNNLDVEHKKVPLENQNKNLDNVSDTHENRAKLEASLNLLDKITSKNTAHYRLQINSENNKLQINVVNNKTGEVIEQIPSRRLMDFYGMIEELNGLIVEKHV